MRFEGILTGQVYSNFIENTLPPFIEEELETGEMWFQQDGAPAHTARISTEKLNEMFGDQWIGIGGPVEYPARSPDLTPCDFSVWGFIQSKVYATPVANNEELWQKIQDAFTQITPEMIMNIRKNIVKRLRCCADVVGRHIENRLIENYSEGIEALCLFLSLSSLFRSAHYMPFAPSSK